MLNKCVRFDGILDPQIATTQSQASRDDVNEKLPILTSQRDMSVVTNGNTSDRKEMIVNIDDVDQAAAGRIWRGSSYDFWKEADARVDAALNGGGDGSNGEFRFPEPVPVKSQAADGGGGVGTDSPSKLIGQFLHRQRASGEISLDMDELATVAEAVDSKDSKVAFSPSKVAADGSEVLRCTSNDAHQRKSMLLRSKTKSRLLDPLGTEQINNNERKSGKLPGKSGFLSGKNEEDEDDPFMDEDFPDEENLNKCKFGLVPMAEWISLVLIIAAVVCSVSIPVLKTKSVWNLKLWKWEVLVLVLICGRLVSGWVVRIVVFLIMHNFLLRKRVLYFVYGLRKAVQNCLWLGLVLLTWHFLFDKRIKQEMDRKALQYVTKVLVCFLIGTLIWLVKTLVVKVVASGYHVSTFFDRIHESLFIQYVIQTLSGPRKPDLNAEEKRLEADMQRFQNAGASIPPELKASAFASNKVGQDGKSEGMDNKTPNARSHKLSGSGATPNKQDDGIPIDHWQRMNPKNVSAWSMKRLMNIVRRGSLTTLDEQLMDATQVDEKQMQIRSELEAKAAAKKIFQNVAKPRSKCIYFEDLLKFMGKDEAEKTLNLFEGASETGKISKSCLKNWVVNAFRERRALALTLNDTKTAVNRLHKMVNVIVGIIIGIIWLIILGIATSKLILVVSSQLVVAAFIFGNTLKTVFEAIIFLFVVHPFDVGDRCEIDGVQMIVEEMNILSTVFLRYDNQKIVYLNSLLATKAIHNYYRSPDMGDAIDFCVHICTPAEKIAQIKQRITHYIDNKPEHWQPSPMIVLRDVEELQRLKLSVWLSHKMNHQDMGERWVRRAQLVEEMVRIFKEVDLQYRLYPVEINVRAMPGPGPNSARVPPGWAPAVS